MFKAHTLHDALMMDICHYTFGKTHKMYSTENEPQGKLWALGSYYVSM